MRTDPAQQVPCGRHADAPDRDCQEPVQRTDMGDGFGKRSRREAERKPFDTLEDEGEADAECAAGDGHAGEHEQIATAEVVLQARGVSHVGGIGQVEGWCRRRC